MQRLINLNGHKQRRSSDRTARAQATGTAIARSESIAWLARYVAPGADSVPGGASLDAGAGAGAGAPPVSPPAAATG